MDTHAKLSRPMFLCTFTLAMFLAPALDSRGNHAPKGVKLAAALRFDAVIELNAPLCRTHVVIFARYWVSPEAYRAAVVWAEPYAGSLNFPVYPPTLNVAADPNAFSIAHQFQHMYDGAFTRPLGPRGPFYHKFNSYRLSDMRLAEQDALDLRIRLDDIGLLKDAALPNGERTLDISRPTGPDKSPSAPAKLKVRAAEGQIEQLQLLDSDDGLLKAIEYEYAKQNDTTLLQRQNVLLPERPITVGFKGQGPKITIDGQTRQYSQLETKHHAGGRKCIVEYQPVEIAGRNVPLPASITVHTADANSLLRSARLFNYTTSNLTPEQIKKAAAKFSLYDPDLAKSRELLIKYWLEDPKDIPQADATALERIHARFSQESPAANTPGEQLRRANVLMKTDWMLGDSPRLETHFEQYLSLLAANHLHRMLLFGGQNIIDTTIRWGQPAAADSLLRTWLEVASSKNKAESILDFAQANLRRGRFWTIARLIEKLLEQTARLSPSQRFAAEALQCMALARMHQVLEEAPLAKGDFAIAQAAWIASKTDARTLRTQLGDGIARARRLFASLDAPTRRDKALMAQLDGMLPDTQKPGQTTDNRQDSQEPPRPKEK